MVCHGEGGVWALLTSDVIGYPGEFVAAVREQVASRTALPANAVLLSAIHTHSGPAGQRTYDESRVSADDEYRVWLVTD
jgi:hypothetical protein